MLGAMEGPDVLTVGDVMVDVRVPADALPAGHVVGRLRVRPGGSAANAAAWAAAAGATSAVVGRIGDDVAGAAIRLALEGRRVDALLAVDPKLPTGIVLVLGESVVAERGANARLTPADVPADLAAPAVLVSGYTLLHEDTCAAGQAALERAAGPWIAIDAASAGLVAHVGRTRFLALTEGATALLLNDDEAAALTGERGESAARALAGSYRLVCVKQGERGAVAVHEGRLERVGVPDARAVAVEVTGAGDAFAGALLAELARGRSAADALGAACKAGTQALGAPDGWPRVA